MNAVTIHHSPKDIMRLCGIPKAKVDGRSVRPWPPSRDGRNAPRNGGRDGMVAVPIDSPVTTRPWLGEMGYEIRFAAYLRAFSDTGKTIIPCSRPGSVALYADFIKDFIAHDIKCEGMCAIPRPDTAPPASVMAKWSPPNVHAIRPCQVSQHVMSRFVVYGNRVDKYDGVAVIHARARAHVPARNWPVADWQALILALRKKNLVGRVVCIGSPDAALLIPDCEDARGLGLQTQMDILHSARFAFGPSSGPMHLAALCECPHVVWCGGPRTEPVRTIARYNSEWNPFGTACLAMPCGNWRPSPATVIEWVAAFLKTIGSGVVSISAPPPPAPRPVATAPAHAIPPTPPRGPGAFRPALIDVPDSGKIGVGVLTYLGLDDVKRNVPSVVKHAPKNAVVLVFDNTETDEIGQWLKANCPSVLYVKSPDGNVGCSNGRNRIAELLGAKGCKYIVIQDQDVGWKGDVVRPMIAVFKAHPKTGLVTSPLALKQMGSHKTGADGSLTPPEAPGMCCMYAMEAIAAAGGWNPEMFMYRFDTLFGLTIHYCHDYGVRAIARDVDVVAHNHPHAGVKRYPHWKHEQHRSQEIFLSECKRLGIPVPRGMNVRH